MPRKHCHTLVRSRGSRILTAETVMVKLYDYTQKREKGWEDWQFRTVSQAHAQREVEAGRAERVTRMMNGDVRLVGYRALTPTRPLERTPCTLTVSTMNAVSKRADREKLDLYERLEVEKFDVWALVGTMKGGGVRPRISDEDRRKAGRLLGEHRLPIGATFDAGMLQAA